MKLKEEFKPCPLTIHGKVCLLIRSRPSHPAVLGPDSFNFGPTMSSHENGIEEEEKKGKENEADCKERKAEKTSILSYARFVQVWIQLLQWMWQHNDGIT